MILVADEKNLGPEIRLQAVLGFDHREVIAGGNDAAIENDEIVFAGDEDDLLRLAGSEGKSGEQSEQDPGSERWRMIYSFISDLWWL